MKSTIIILLIVIGLASCGRDIYSDHTEACTTSATGDTIALAYQRALPIFEKCAGNMTASITSINDSRCPTGVQCVWAGTAKVVVQFDGKFDIPLEIGKMIDTVYNEKKFSLSLIDVRPHPTAGAANVPEGAVAVVRIQKSDLLTGIGYPGSNTP